MIGLRKVTASAAYEAKSYTHVLTTRRVRTKELKALLPLSTPGLLFAKSDPSASTLVKFVKAHNIPCFIWPKSSPDDYWDAQRQMTEDARFLIVFYGETKSDALTEHIQFAWQNRVVITTYDISMRQQKIIWH